jgi:hypothetical protein
MLNCSTDEIWIILSHGLAGLGHGSINKIESYT